MMETPKEINEQNADPLGSSAAAGSDAVLDAAYDFVDSMKHRADVIHNHTTPMWYGWALREAFIAGSKFKG